MALALTIDHLEWFSVCSTRETEIHSFPLLSEPFIEKIVLFLLDALGTLILPLQQQERGKRARGSEKEGNKGCGEGQRREREEEEGREETTTTNNFISSPLAFC